MLVDRQSLVAYRRPFRRNGQAEQLTCRPAQRLGLLAPRNATTATCLFVCAVSMAGAILLLMEMSHPFDGFIEASPGPLLNALSLIGR